MKRINGLLITLLLVIPFTLVWADTGEQIEELSTLYRRGQFADVVMKAGDMLEKQQLGAADSAAVLQWLSRACAQNKQEGQAQSYFAALVKLDPNTNFDNGNEPSLVSKAWAKFVNDTGYKPGQFNKMLTVAVVEFENGSIVDADKYKTAGLGVSELVRYNLISSGLVYVPSRSHFNYLKQEIEASQAGMMDENYQIETGKVIGASNFIFGTFMKMQKNKVRIMARVIDTETTLPKKTFSVQGDDDKIGDLSMELADSIMAYFEVEAEAIKDAKSKVPEVNLAALLAFSQGFAYEEEGNYKKAEQFYAQALEISPDFVLASDRQQRVELEMKAAGQ